MALQGPIIDAMVLADDGSILLVQAPHGIEQILHLLGVQGHQSGHRGAGIGHRGQRGVTGDSGGVSGHTPSTLGAANTVVSGINIHVRIHEWISTGNIK